jgi:hypothetical protein
MELKLGLLIQGRILPHITSWKHKDLADFLLSSWTFCFRENFACAGIMGIMFFEKPTNNPVGWTVPFV